MKRLLSTVLIFCILSSTAVFAADKLKGVANINQEFSLSEIPQKIEFTLPKNIKKDDFTIPANSVITMKTVEAENERRWHKSGFILLKAESYKTKTGKIVNLRNKELYFTARKYEKMDKKEIAVTGTETIVASAASFVIPGVDIAYYFTKGAIKRDNNPNWFKSGVSSAYENSIFWIWLKGKPIELEENDTVSLKEIDKDRAYKLKSGIERRKVRKLKRAQKKIQKS